MHFGMSDGPTDRQTRLGLAKLRNHCNCVSQTFYFSLNPQVNVPIDDVTINVLFFSPQQGSE